MEISFNVGNKFHNIASGHCVHDDSPLYFSRGRPSRDVLLHPGIYAAPDGDYLALLRLMKCNLLARRIRKLISSLRPTF